MTKKISQVEKLAKMQDDLNANKTNVTCTSATVTKSHTTSESATDKLESAKVMEESKELSATAILKQNVTSTLQHLAEDARLQCTFCEHFGKEN
jgi:uncharacterized protein (DUF3084 family)